jgi:peptidoglycan hydrolase-like protein with peptidoglycan-binding domain
MNHAVRALVTLALGAGLAVAAQAQGTTPQSSTAGGTPPTATAPTTAPTAAAPTQPTEKAARPARMTRNAAKARGARNEVRQAQEQLKSEGLYRGRIDGRMGRGTHLALSRFQQRNGLRHTASLDRITANRLLGGHTTGVGSSKPMTTPSQSGAGGDNPTSRPKLNRY